MRRYSDAEWQASGTLRHRRLCCSVEDKTPDAPGFAIAGCHCNNSGKDNVRHFRPAIERMWTFDYRNDTKNKLWNAYHERTT
jgi:hypothetical protein